MRLKFKISSQRREHGKELAMSRFARTDVAQGRP